ncbi:MAG: hypothetical protein Q4B28_03910 [bacterium]|nr:hypothetical protein [bacterium]
MYSQDGKLLGTVNAENGEILIEKAYTNQLHLSVSFEKHHPIIKLMQGNKMLFDVTLSPEKILGLEVKKGELIPLKGQSFGQFDQGYALMINKKPLLYISPTGELSSKANIEATYHFDSKQKAIQYHIKEHRF